MDGAERTLAMVDLRDRLQKARRRHERWPETVIAAQRVEIPIGLAEHLLNIHDIAERELKVKL